MKKRVTNQRTWRHKWMNPDRFTLWAVVILLGWCLPPAGAGTGESSYWYYDNLGTQHWDVMAFTCLVREMTFEIDSGGTIHVFASVAAAAGGNKLWYSCGSDGRFSEPAVILQALSMIEFLASAVGCDDVIHLVWSDVDYDVGNLYYTSIEGGSVTDFRTICNGSAWHYPWVMTDKAGNTHIAFSYLSMETNEPVFRTPDMR